MTIASPLESTEHGALGMGPASHPSTGYPTNPTEQFPPTHCSRVKSMSLCFESLAERPSQNTACHCPGGEGRAVAKPGQPGEMVGFGVSLQGVCWL